MLAPCSRLAQVPLSPFLCCLTSFTVCPKELTLPLRLRSVTNEGSLLLSPPALHGVKVLLNAVRWKGSSAFFRRCLSLTSRPTRSVATPCGVVTPDCDLEDPQAGPSGEASAYSSFTTSASPLSLASVFYILFYFKFILTYINLLYSEGRRTVHRVPLVLLSLNFLVTQPSWCFQTYTITEEHLRELIFTRFVLSELSTAFRCTSLYSHMTGSDCVIPV